jgi:hypothetical protein
MTTTAPRRNTPRRNTPGGRSPMPTGRRNMPRPRPPAKPKTTRQWLDRKFAPKKYRTMWGRIFGNLYKGVRGISRAADRRAERVRERKRARIEMREHTLPPTWAEQIRTRREQERGPANQCLACGKSLTQEQMKDHVLTCGSSPTPAAAAPKPKKAKTTAPAPAAPAPIPAAPSAHPTRAELDDEVRQWKRERAAYRKANMTRRERAADVARRGAVRFAGYGGKCRTCGMNLTRSDMATHRCGGAYRLDSDPTVPTPATPAPAPTPVPSAPAAPAAGPSPAAPSTTNRKEAPVAFGRGQTGTSNGSTQTGGGGNSSAYAQQILQAMQSWSQDIPKTHTEMGANMQAMSTMCTTMSQLVSEFQNRLINMPPGPNGEPRGFHPSTVAPLSGPTQRFAEASAGFTETFVAITRYYQVLIDMHQSGTPVPDANYLRG